MNFYLLFLALFYGEMMSWASPITAEKDAACQSKCKLDVLKTCIVNTLENFSTERLLEKCREEVKVCQAFCKSILSDD